MGDVVVSAADKALEVEAKEKDKEKTEEESGTESKGGEMNGLMRWEKFLPRMILRVLLVEADDSTRQIISALLRKCSYRVAAVPDGLKAWEILKGRPHNIDLILTEVDLPSISGYALLTLIMEHEICKNIPVIMMSSQDSISTVYKCMLKGAADYLVKPIRKNELRNLWQHVWRRQSSTIGVNGPLDESVAQQKVEATAENNAASPSSGDAACIQKNKELIEKGSDAQLIAYWKRESFPEAAVISFRDDRVSCIDSCVLITLQLGIVWVGYIRFHIETAYCCLLQSSCTKPDLEAESAPVGNVQESAHKKCGDSYPSEKEMQEVETHIHLGQISIMHDNHAGGLTVGICKNGETSTTLRKDGDPEHRRSASISGEAHNNHYVQISSSKEAIDLIGAFRTHPNCSLKNSSVNCTGMFDFSPQLDLSLRRSHPSNSENEVTEERHTLMHSDASAFKRYTTKQLQAPPTAFINFGDLQREQRSNCDKNIANVATVYNSDSSTPTMQRSFMSPTTAQSKESELATSHSQQGHSLPIPVKGIRFNDLCKAYGSVLPPMFSTQSGPPSIPRSSAVHLEPTFQANAYYHANIKENSSEQLFEPRGQNGNNPPNHVVYLQDHKLEQVEDRGHISPATDQSGSSSFCNENLSRMNSIGYGSNCGSNSNVDQAPIVRTASEVRNEDLTNNASSHRSIQREAALNKFRLKRKERCYEKKVRYESRKKLAEQRPRVKGQFVRQVHPDLQAQGNDGREYDL
ncbi:two-component response regulator-like APRR5 isoform X1 [Senna tora]|uniref:Two-component response regulator-like APRR5 isoform X1 n=1 Tax=Senna tora TaxID=362788 RepID=A0A834WBR2_9FABA|nr:two-component response regulator-like APRR5 isoform X1 [Senna tora]